MNLLNIFKPKPRSAEAARDRLQILLAHERVSGGAPDFLPRLQRDILEVIRRYIEIDNDRVAVRVEKEGEMSLLELNIELPQAHEVKS
jgi:cell division topological specificity factor